MFAVFNSAEHTRPARSGSSNLTIPETYKYPNTNPQSRSLKFHTRIWLHRYESYIQSACNIRRLSLQPSYGLKRTEILRKCFHVACSRAECNNKAINQWEAADMHVHALLTVRINSLLHWSACVHCTKTDLCLCAVRS